MKKLDEKQDYSLEKVEQLINNLETKNIITKKEAEAIDPLAILEFTKTFIWQEMKQAKSVQREKPFYINIPANEIYDQGAEDEKVLVQGIIDLYYQTKEGEYVLVDYKTDYVEKGNEQELIDKYKIQIELYKKALEEALKTKVDKCYIYSTILGGIEINI